MRTRNHSFVTALVLLSLFSGAIGCQSNGGAWYKPNSYSWHNPFKTGKETISPYSDRTAAAKPSAVAQPNVTAPPGGYSDKSRDADLQAGKTEKQVQAQLQVQHGNTITGGAIPDANRVAMSDPPVYGANVPAGYTYPDPGASPYPNQYSPNTGGILPNYPQTSIQQSADYATPNGTGAPSAYPAPPPSNYSPFAAPAYDATPPQGFAAPATPYSAAPQQGLVAPQQNYGAPANYNNGFGADANGYTAPPSYGSGYTATPSTTGF